MLESFVLVLTLCGNLNIDGFTCDNYVLDSKQTEISCLHSVLTVYNREYSHLYNLMSEAGKDWLMVSSTHLHCLKESVE